MLYKLASSRWLTRTGNHIEHRPGLVNFSVVGRNARPSQRKNYYEWDCIIEERINIGYSILKILVNFKYFVEVTITKIADPIVNIFINVDRSSTI